MTGQDQPAVDGISGFARPRFEPLRAAFADIIAEPDEMGAGFAAVVDGETVADLVGGWLDRARTQAWPQDALPCVYSSGKAVIAVLIARLVSAGALDYDAPVARHWPAFAAAGKQDITLAQALSHQAGLCGFSEPMAPDLWLDWEAVVAKIADMAPLWPPGTAHGYHPQTVGYIAGEIVRRVTGRTIGDILREDDFNARRTDVHCGVRDGAAARIAAMRKPPKPPDLGAMSALKEIAFLKPWSSPARVGREAWAAAEIPASNMHASARGLAELVHPFAVDGARPDGAALDPAVVRAALAPRAGGDDLVLPFRLTWSAGLMANEHGWYGPSPTAFGHAGFGGSCVFVDPPRRLSAAFVVNRMSPFVVGDPRPKALLDALYEAL